MTSEIMGESDSIHTGVDLKTPRMITAALPYINNLPHLGNVVGCVLSADVYSRHSKLMGVESIYICGTDEYGTATEMSAIQKNMHPREICEKNAVEHKKIYDWFEIDFDYWGRTSKSYHTEMVHKIFKMSYDNGYFEEKDEMQFFCKTCDIYLADRYTEGICDNCEANTNGDQCDKCGKVHNVGDIKDPICVLCGNTPTFKTTTHLFFKLDKFSSVLNGICNSTWSKNAVEITQTWLKKDLHSRAMTRSLKYKWGVPVPIEKFEDKVFYVWFDAPIGYFSYAKELLGADFKRWCKESRLIQFMGKDNVPFHSLIFPSLIISTGVPYDDLDSILEKHTKTSISEGEKSEKLLEKLSIDPKENLIQEISRKLDYKLLDTLSSTEYLLFHNKKFSKSKNIGIFGQDLVENSMGDASSWRYYLMKIRPETKDANISIKEFISYYQSDLQNNIGNMVQRTLKYLKKYHKETGEKINYDQSFIKKINEEYQGYISAMEKIQIRSSINHIIAICIASNQKIQQSIDQKDKKETLETFRTVYSVICLLSVIISPLMPTVSKKISQMTGINYKKYPKTLEIQEIITINEVEPLFPMLSEQVIKNLERKSL